MTRKTLIGCLLVTILTVGSGLLHGRLTNRWGASDLSIEAGERLSSLPRGDVGDWTLGDSMPLSENVVTTLECTGYATRVYENRKSDSSRPAVIRLFALVGRVGPTVAHTPDVCYAGRDYKTIDEAHRQRLTTPDGIEHEFWTTVLESRDQLNSHRLEVWHGWSIGDVWMAPKYQRFAFLGRPFVYKLQLAFQLPDGQETGTKEIEAFLLDFLPQLANYLEPSNAS